MRSGGCNLAPFVACVFALLPIAAAQVSTCSFPSVACATCIGRYKTGSGSSYKDSTIKCGWCGAKTLNASDPSSANGYCLDNNDASKAEKCQGQNFLLLPDSRRASAQATCETAQFPAGIAVGVAVGIAALISSGLCYWRATGHAGSRQFKYIFVGLVLPVLSVIIVEILAKKGHFQAHSAPHTANAASDVVPNLHDAAAPYNPDGGVYGAAGAAYSSGPYVQQQQQGYGYAQPGYSSEMRAVP